VVAANAIARAQALRRLLDGAGGGLDQADVDFVGGAVAIAVAMVKQKAEPFVRKGKW
jgi:hypothetical protein